MMRIKKHGDGEGKMGTVYIRKKKETSLDWVFHYGVLPISFRLLFQLFSSCICSKQDKTNDRRVRKVSGTVIDR